MSIMSFVIFLVSCDKEVFTGINGIEAALFGKVFVSSDPAGYKLYIDNKYMSRVSPDSIPFITVGTHKLTLKHEYFSDSLLTIEVKKESPLSINLDMMKSSRFYSMLSCDTDPQGAKIYLDDQPTNLVTPAVIPKLYPGPQELKFIKTQFRDDSCTVSTKGGQWKEISRKLEDTSRIVTYNLSNSKIFSDNLTKVAVDKNNNKWVGSTDCGLIKYDGKRWTSYIYRTGSFVNDLLADSKGRLWIGTTEGLTMFDGSDWQSLTDYLPSRIVTAMDEDKNGNIWIATSEGLVKYDNVFFTSFNSRNTGVPLTNLTSVSASPNGDIWAGTTGSGILRFNGSSWTQYLTNNMNLGLQNFSDIIKDVLVDNMGNVWTYNKYDQAGQRGRVLLRFDGAKWVEVVLPENYESGIILDIYSFYLDSEDNIWIATNRGMIKFSYSEPIKVYGQSTYGAVFADCSSFAIDNDGDGWFTTNRGGIVRIKKGNY